MKKRFIFIICLLSITLFIGATKNTDTIKINFIGSNLNFKNQPVIKDGCTMVPFKELADKFGYNTEIQDSKLTLKINSYLNIIFNIGNIDASFNDELIKAPKAPELINGTAYVPLRFISELLGYNVQYQTYNGQQVINISNDNSFEFKLMK